MGLAQQDVHSVCTALKMSTDAGRRDYFGSCWLQAQPEADGEKARLVILLVLTSVNWGGCLRQNRVCPLW